MEPDANQYEGPSLGDLFKVVRRRKWSLIFPALLVFLAAVAVALALPSVYRSSATILIEEQEIPAEFVQATVTSYAEERIQMIRQRVMSFTRLNDLVTRFNLYPERRDSWTAEQIVGKMRADIRVEPVSAQPRTGRASAATIAFTLAYEGKDPQTVLQVANTLTSLFLAENQQVRERQTAETAQFLEAEMNRVGQELSQLDAQIAAFKEAHLHELPEMFRANLDGKERTERDIERFTDQLRMLKERENYLHSQLSSLSMNFGNEDRRRLEELKIQLVSLKTRFTDEYPDVIRIRREIAEMEKQVSEARATRPAGSDNTLPATDPDNPVHVNLSAQLVATQSEMQSLERQIQALILQTEQYRQRIEATPMVENTYKGLTTERDNTQVKYNDLMSKYMESQVAHGMERERKGERFTLIDPARLPQKPVKPNRLVIAMIGLVLAMGTGVAFAALREYSDNSIRDFRRLVRASPFPVLAGIPRLETQADRLRGRLKRVGVTLGLVAIIAGGLYAFHHLVMDLEVFWTKISARFELFL